MRTSPNRSVVIGLADCVALFATRSGRRMSFRKNEGVRWALRASRLELFAEGNLLRGQAFLPVDGGPTGSCVPAAQELLIDPFVAGTAITGSKVSTDDESVVIDLLLIGTGLVAVEAIDALLRVGRHLVFMDDRVLKPCMALSALSRRPYKVGRRLSRFDLRTLPIDKES